MWLFEMDGYRMFLLRNYSNDGNGLTVLPAIANPLTSLTFLRD